MNKYQTILSVCETRSISKTAALLNYTQSAVSQTIKNFEKELGLELFIRSKNGMELKSDMAGSKSLFGPSARPKTRLHGPPLLFPLWTAA